MSQFFWCGSTKHTVFDAGRSLSLVSHRMPQYQVLFEGRPVLEYIIPSTSVSHLSSTKIAHCRSCLIDDLHQIDVVQKLVRLLGKRSEEGPCLRAQFNSFYNTASIRLLHLDALRNQWNRHMNISSMDRISSAEC